MSTAIRYQLRLAGTFILKKFFFDEIDWRQSHENIPTHISTKICLRLKRIKVRENNYKEGDFYLLNITKGGQPLYGKITLLFTDKDDPKNIDDFFVICKIIRSLYYDEHFCAWAVEEKEKFIALPLKSVNVDDRVTIVQKNEILYIPDE